MAFSARHALTGRQTSLCNETPRKLVGGASAVVKSAPPASALVPASTCFSQHIPYHGLPDNSSRVLRLASSRGFVRFEPRAGGEQLLLNRAAQGNAQSRPKNTPASSAEERNIQHGAAPALSGEVESNCVVKTCPQCRRSKPIVDFEKTVATLDGRTDECRACLAVVRAKRGGKALHHLGLSVEESWEWAKTCTKCGLVKEFRDFSRRAANKDGTYGCCRACHSDLCVARRQRGPHEPTDEPQRCTACLEVREADQFFPDGGQLTGRKSVCRVCLLKQKAEQYQRAKEVQIHVWKATRRCWTCQQEKPRSEFYRRPLTIGGLSSNCIACLKIYEKTRHEKGKEGQHMDG